MCSVYILQNLLSKLSITADSTVLLRHVYDAISETLDGPSIAAAVLIVAKYNYQSAFVADQEINLLRQKCLENHDKRWKPPGGFH